MTTSFHYVTPPGRQFRFRKSFIHIYSRLDWFGRIGGDNGWGLSVQVVGPDYKPLFSERNGYHRIQPIYIGTWRKKLRIHVLTPSKRKKP